MAQSSAPVSITGNVVKSERKKGDMPAPEDPTRTITWDFIEARVLTPAFDTVDVRFPADGSVVVPDADVTVVLDCEARATRQGLRVTVKAVKDAA